MKRVKKLTFAIATICVCACSESDIITPRTNFEPQTLQFGLNQINNQSRADLSSIDMSILRNYEMGVLGLKRDSSITNAGYEYVCNNTRMVPDVGAMLWAPVQAIGINRSKKYSFLTYGPYNETFKSEVNPDSGYVSIELPMCQMISENSNAIDYIISQPMQDISGNIDWQTEREKSHFPMSLYHGLCRVQVAAVGRYNDGRTVYVQGARICLPDTTKRAELRCYLESGDTHYVDTAYNFLDKENLYSEYTTKFEGDGVKLKYHVGNCKLFDFYIAPLRDETKVTKIKIEIDLMIEYSDPNAAPDYITIGADMPITIKKNKHYQILTQLQNHNIQFKGNDFDKMECSDIEYIDFTIK